MINERGKGERQLSGLIVTSDNYRYTGSRHVHSDLASLIFNVSGSKVRKSLEPFLSAQHSQIKKIDLLGMQHLGSRENSGFVSDVENISQTTFDGSHCITIILLVNTFFRMREHTT